MASMFGSAFSLSRFLLKLRTTKRWWIPLTLLIIILCNLAGLVLPKKYLAQAIVRIHDPRMEALTGNAAKVLTITERLKSIGAEITSYTFLREVARQQNLDVGVDPDSAAYDRLILKMTRAVVLENKEENDHFTLAYTADSPKRARDVCEAIVQRYINNSNFYFESKTKGNEGLLQSQLDEAQTRLEKAQNDVMAYKRDNRNEIPDAQEEILRRMGQLRMDQQNSVNLLGSLRNSKLVISQQLESLDRINAPLPVMPKEAPQIDQLRNQRTTEEFNLNKLLQDFTDDHWQVKASRAQLKLIDKQIKTLEEAQAKQAPKEADKAGQTLHQTLEKFAVDEQRLVAQIDEQTSAVRTMETHLNNIPNHQVALGQLESSRRLAEDRVDSLRKLLDAAKITGAIEKKGLGPSFEIIDYPRASLEPVFPQPKKILILSLVLGLGAGQALVYLLTLLDSAVRSVEEARGLLQMPVLGVMQRIASAAQERSQWRRRRRKIVGMSAGLALILVVVALGLAFYRVPLQQSLEDIRNLLNR